MGLFEQATSHVLNKFSKEATAGFKSAGTLLVSTVDMEMLAGGPAGLLGTGFGAIGGGTALYPGEAGCAIPPGGAKLDVEVPPGWNTWPGGGGGAPIGGWFGGRVACWNTCGGGAVAVAGGDKGCWCWYVMVLLDAPPGSENGCNA